MDRLELCPGDQILFVKIASVDSTKEQQVLHVFEGVVCEVHRKSAYVNVEMNAPKQMQKMRLDLYQHMVEFELLRLFRPAPGHHHGPVGFYLTEPTDIWLDIDDKIQLTKQGGTTHKPIDPNHAYTPEVFEARVVAISAHLCYITPLLSVSKIAETLSDPPPPPPPPEKLGESKNDPLTKKTSEAGEWVPRNTLRFQQFIKRRHKPKHLSLIPHTPIQNQFTYH